MTDRVLSSWSALTGSRACRTIGTVCGLATLAALTGLVSPAVPGSIAATVSPSSSPAAQSVEEALEVPEGHETAVFAGGCFWCMEPPYDKLDGVTATLSGFAGGQEQDPSYDDVASGRTGHTEVVRVTYDPDVVTYEELLEVFWRNHDPLDAGGQFCDRGSQYRPAIFYQDEEQERLAEASKEKWQESGRFEAPIVTEIEPLERFWPAEEYHQDFYEKNPGHYERYRTGCRRDARLQELWGDP